MRRTRGQHSRPSPSPLYCPRCVTRLALIEGNVERRPTALRRAELKDSCLFAVCHGGVDRTRERVHDACMVWLA